jgi:hypothetical protein
MPFEGLAGPSYEIRQRHQRDADHNTPGHTRLDREQSDIYAPFLYLHIEPFFIGISLVLHGNLPVIESLPAISSFCFPRPAVRRCPRGNDAPQGRQDRIELVVKHQRHRRCCIFLFQCSRHRCVCIIYEISGLKRENIIYR